MADYYPLLSRAIVNLGDSAAPDVRRAIYDRARMTLLSQMERAQPPLPPDQIERERASLEAVIARIEIETRSRSGAQPTMRPLEPRDEPEPVRRGRGSAPAVEPLPDPEEADEAGYPSHDGTETDPPLGSERPSYAPGLPAKRGPDWRLAALAAAAVVVVGGMAGLAYTLRDRVNPEQRDAAERAANNPPNTPPPSPDSKLPDRVGGQPPPGPAPSPAPDNPQALPVAQRATLFLEVPGATDQVPRTVAGRVVWKFANLPARAGQPLDPALVGEVEIPDAGMALRWQMTRNRDDLLPASHLVGLVFTTKDSSVKAIAPVLLKTDESERGAPLVGIQQSLGANLFVMALSNGDADQAKNFDLLTKRGWLEVQFQLADNRRGAIVFEKGLAGDRALLAAIDAWK